MLNVFLCLHWICFILFHWHHQISKILFFCHFNLSSLKLLQLMEFSYVTSQLNSLLHFYHLRNSLSREFKIIKVMSFNPHPTLAIFHFTYSSFLSSRNPILISLSSFSWHHQQSDTCCVNFYRYFYSVISINKRFFSKLYFNPVSFFPLASPIENVSIFSLFLPLSTSTSSYLHISCHFFIYLQCWYSYLVFSTSVFLQSNYVTRALWVIIIKCSMLICAISKWLFCFLKKVFIVLRKDLWPLITFY